MKKQAAFVGIDPSISNTGLVVLDTYGKLLHFADGKNSYGKEQYSYDIDRYLCQSVYIVHILQKYSARAICYEHYAFNSVHQAYSLAEYGGVLKAQIYAACNREVELVAPLRNKKFATGCGTADKKMMQRQAGAECPELAGASDDVCDAYFLAKYGFYKQFPQRAVQLDRGNPHLRTRLEMTMCLEMTMEEKNNG
jgi:Holliday junction resolvasome RuvABC endonuclease subunit